MNNTPPSPAPPPIVAIGASAGGLASLQGFLAALPAAFDFALVFVQHLSVKHKSLLAELLHTNRPKLKVVEITSGQTITPGRLYLCPPSRDAGIRQGVFQLSEPPEGHLHLPIDEFFISLADEAGEQAIGVVFSGTGNDGTRGVRAIRDAGGTIFVEEPTTAEYTAMPLAAIATGRVDAVLPAADIAREIVRLLGTAAAPAARPGLGPWEFEAFCRLILEKTGLRFHHYKKSVVTRRISRRMHLRGIAAAQEYLDLLGRDSGEAAAMAADLLIGVTAFFRDRLAWKALRLGALRKLVAAEAASGPVRVWTPASATGEETYSIAMLLADELGRAGGKREVQVFATDLSDAALEKAGEGRYPASIAADVPPEYLLRFFTPADDGATLLINKEIRERVVFARQDLLTDPPFSRLDLIICRNLLIYLEPEAQKKCLAIFHYALKQGGYLFLGNAESTGSASRLFKSLAHKKCRVYQKVEAGADARVPIAVPFAEQTVGPSARPTVPDGQPVPPSQQALFNFIQERLLEEYGPAAVAINQHGDILYHNGPTSRYLQQPRGMPTRNLLEQLPAAVKPRLRAAILRAGKESRPVSLQAIIPAGEAHRARVSLRISKLRGDLLLVTFREKGAALEPDEGETLEEVAAGEATLRQLEGELAATRADLQLRIEQSRGVNEELQSSNEELQAANEELEASREELQSVNEELITVNSQLQAKIEEQQQTNDDLNNFLASTSIPTLFLDLHLRVRRFTPAMARLIKLIPSDTGRPISDLSMENLGPELIADAAAVSEHLAPVRRELNLAGSWYIRTMLTYRTADNRIDGVVINYTEVSELKAAEERLQHMASFPLVNPNAIVELDHTGRVVFSNPAAQKFLIDFGMDPADTTVFLPSDIEAILRGWDRQEPKALYREIKLRDRVFGENIYLVPQFQVARIYSADVTERKRAEVVTAARLRLAEAAYGGGLSVDELLRLTVDEIEAATGSAIGFYHFLEEDQETLALRNWSTNTVATMCTAAGQGSHYNISKAGVWVDCVRERRPVIHNDYAALPHRKGLPAGHAPVSREMVVPIFRGERIVAIIGVGNKPTDYEAADIECARLLGDFSWEIVERKLAEEEIRKHAAELQAANDDLARINRAAVDRELRMVELKKEINALCGKTGEMPRYRVDFEEDGYSHKATTITKKK